MRTIPDSRDQGGDQRFLTFMLLSVSIFLFSQLWFGPPPQPRKQVAQQEEEQAEDGATDGEEAVDPQVVEAATETAKIEALPDAEPQLVSIGSAEVDGPYRLLLTLDNEGAAVRRAEISASKFRDLDDRSGYLGELELAENSNGNLAVQVVPRGSPAEAAGFQVGDQLVDSEAFLASLAKTKPKQPIEVPVLRNGEQQTLTATLARRPLSILRPESENVRLHSPKIADEITDVPSFLVTLAELNKLDEEDEELIAANEQLIGETWDVVESDATTVTFRKRLVALGLEVEKRFRVVETPAENLDEPEFPGYHFELEVAIKNLLPTPQKVAYRIQGPNGLPIEGWWYANRIGRTESGNGSWGAVGIRDVVARYADSNFIQWRCNDIVEDDAEPMGQGAPMAYIGVDSQYFSVVMMPMKESLRDVWFDTAEALLATDKLPERDTRPTYNNTTFTAVRQPVTLQAAGEEDAAHADGFRIFAGPKRPELLAQEAYAPAGDTNYGLQNVLYYGWFGFVSRPMLFLLHSFYGVVGNYGVAIVMLTVLVRGAMFPLSRKQAMNMAMMQQLKPEMDRIAEKYKDDMQKRGQAQQELFRKHNYNPMGGCVLMLFQLPIFIGLYRALAVDIELRQAPLFSESIRFCSNLGAPDAFLDWSGIMPQWFTNGHSVVGLGPYLNILPIVTIVLFLLQQKMFMPEATTDQARLQQQMMKYMMIVFGIMFFKVPSGLCLYFIATSLWSMAERKLLPKPEPPSETGFSKPKSPEKKSPSKSAAKKPGGQSGGGKKKKKKRR